MNDKIVVKSPSKDDLNWNDDKTGVNREDFHSQVVIIHSVLKLTWKNGSTFLEQPSKMFSCCGSLFGQIWPTFASLVFSKKKSWAHISLQCMKWRNPTNVWNVTLYFSQDKSWAQILLQCMKWRNPTHFWNVTLVFSQKKSWTHISLQCMKWWYPTNVWNVTLVFSKKKNWTHILLQCMEWWNPTNVWNMT